MTANPGWGEGRKSAQELFACSKLGCMAKKKNLWICVAKSVELVEVKSNKSCARQGRAGVQKYVSTWANGTSPKYVFAQT